MNLPPNVSCVRVRMYHTDLVGLFHGRIFELFEEARTEVFRRLGFEWRLTDETGVAMVVTAVGARFLKQAAMDELLHLGVYVDAISKVQVLIGYEGRRAADDEVLFTGETNFIFVDRARAKPVRIPESILSALRRCPPMIRVQPWPALLGVAPDA